jgi:fructoselysine-6-P-deglycase FrlB-like protein
MSQVEEALRSQREAWREIMDRVSTVSSRELPIELPKRILLFGLGSSHHAARLVGYTLLRDRSRMRVPVVSCSSLAIGLEVLPARGDWAFAISHRGKTPATLAALDACDRAGAFTVLVAGKNAPLPESARFGLWTCPQETVEAHTVSLTGAICAATCLLMGAKALEEWDALRSIGEPDLEFFRSRAGQGPAAIVGEWEGEWLAREGALKLMEMAKVPVHSFGTEEYFHGPRRAFGAKDPLWHVSLPKDPRNAEVKAAHRIGVFGASPLAWVPALVELQWLSLAVALNRNQDPDQQVDA